MARRVQWWSVAWLAGVWVALWGQVSVGNIVAGVLVGVAVTVALPMTPMGFHGRVRPWGVVRLLARFAVDLVRGSLEVAVVALRLGYVPTGAVIAVRLRSKSDLYLTLTAELCSLVPGTVVVDARRLTGTLYLHVLDAKDLQGIEAARAHVLEQEERLLRALASDEELAEAGLEVRR
ncbi:MAG: Na+/H+ antiporter subunit E [Micrococcales bacterium]|nr:Na+/H+ antiporter subunit E [Micrococcales bacterium]MCL2668540.1 Na+/H+ antiporter subunit E [Micrococcales bacterium]